mmetsp:Transcript_30911/g.42837  ORF Transcript_30911/g.42837 Transcript_30911/m.42837 type:complete len:231 (-) Transcript_30911:132-824(-)|eukprot:CAMPEP_0196578434 /NCGR_PEP_ID=MMETSP1081-20130531/7325_1 /TAXON_ID=36882 /ORGANISM="Pyramimonas amylifera, Strain CCMP720" /LENGTH=230 /DNA_ID=CAMNT_0041897647 /DNA_START=174 /DNA_END=866 /DNA_ORIENTATION=+
MASFALHTQVVSAGVSTSLTRFQHLRTAAPRSSVMPSIPRSTRFVCSAAEKGESSTDRTPEETITTEVDLKEVVSTTQAPTVKETTRDVFDVAEDAARGLMFFQSGRASEIMNGRVAMVGFAAALVNELASGNSLFNQMWNIKEIAYGEDITEFLVLPQVGLYLIPVTTAIIVAASLFPQLFGRKDNGLDVPAKSFGPFTPTSEMTNGRAAMLGLVALFAVENFSGTAFF